MYRTQFDADLEFGSECEKDFLQSTCTMYIVHHTKDEMKREKWKVLQLLVPSISSVSILHSTSYIPHPIPSKRESSEIGMKQFNVQCSMQVTATEIPYVHCTLLYIGYAVTNAFYI